MGSPRFLSPCHSSQTKISLIFPNDPFSKIPAIGTIRVSKKEGDGARAAVRFKHSDAVIDLIQIV
jgi:hypothetical protein